MKLGLLYNGDNISLIIVNKL